MRLNAYNVWFAIFPVIGIAVVAPMLYDWVYPQLATHPPVFQFLGTLLFPLFIVLYLASWLDPGAT